MPKLLIITQAVDPKDSALGFFCEWISQFATARPGMKIEVWCLRTGEWPEKFGNVEVRVLPKGRRALVFLGQLLSSRFDSIFVHMSPLWVVLGGWWWRLTGQRVFLWYTHGTRSRLLSAAVLFANSILTATLEAFPVRSRKVLAVGHGISPQFSEMIRIPDPSQSRRFLSVGRITPRKRVKETLDFFSKIVKIEPGARLLWIGEPITESDLSYFDEVEKEVEALNLKDRVEFAGKEEYKEMPEIYAASDLLLHLSDTGSLDKVVLEALAAGCAVFSTNPATKEAVSDAYWAEGLDEAGVREALKRARIGVETGRRREVADRFSLEKLINLILTCLNP